KGRQLKEGNDVVILSIGATGNNAVKAAEQLAEEGISVAVYDMRWAKPIDTAILAHVAEHYEEIVTVEDGVIDGGVGSAVAEYMTEGGVQCRVTRLGINDMFVEHATVAEQKAECGYDVAGICSTIKRLLNK
ncbi:MAG: 1-deoxy-D-xylulose-5-phosphate synthase, partial [Tidjanibacter sp.]|nr:1-deoxy-D-xylulose-5-phosphate synthase [Tidjanibacter sp.]